MYQSSSSINKTILCGDLYMFKIYTETFIIANGNH